MPVQISWKRQVGAYAGLLVMALLPVGVASAHRDDYLDETIVFLTLDQGELETEYWLDYGRNGAEDQHFVRHNVAMEYGLTPHWMVDARATSRNQFGQGASFDSGRFETRYRFGDEGDRPVDVAVSAELNREREDDGTLVTGLEPRLILSRDFRDTFNLTLNLSEEIPVGSERDARFLAAAGMRYNWFDRVRLGAEFHRDASERRDSIVPQVWFLFRSGLTVKAGYSDGLNGNDTDFARVALEYEF